MIREKKLKIRVLLVDDHPLVLEGVRSSLLKHDRFEIVGEASSGPEAIHRARESSPDVVVMDFTMPGMNGLEATTCLRSVCPETKVLILTVHEKAEFVREMIHSGARGYIRKSTSPAEFISAIECVHRGQLFFNPDVAEAFPDAASVNQALRALARIAQTQIRTGAELPNTGLQPTLANRHPEIPFICGHTGGQWELGIRKATELVKFAITRGMVNLTV